MTDDPYAAMADLYDLAYGDYVDDIDFYENLARATDGPVLELGVGTGRVAIPLALAGYDVVGTDRSEAMLARARENLAAARLRRGSLELVLADMTAFELGRRFGFAFIAANTFQHLLTTLDQRACLGSLARHLAPDSLLAISVSSPTSVSWDDAGAPSPLLLDWTRRDPATGETVMKLIASRSDPAHMTRHLTYVYDRLAEGGLRRTVFETELRYSTRAEMEALLQQAGLRVTHVYGDYDLSPMSDTTELLIFVATPEKPS